MRQSTITAAAFAAVMASACSTPSAEEEVAHSEAAATSASMNRVLDDANLTGDQAIGATRIQALLEENGSALATYSEGGRSAATIIVEESRASHISPVFVLARIQGESGLVTSGTLANIEAATGCGCPDGEACDPALANFGAQVRCTAQQFRRYLEDLAADNSTVSGWGVGRGRTTLDGCWVVPANAATAALYTYTPWVGAYAAECGAANVGGTSLMGVLYRQLRKEIGGEGATCPSGEGLYCGATTVGGEEGVLYRCTAGAITPVETCQNGCFTAPPGEDDRCR